MSACLEVAQELGGERRVPEHAHLPRGGRRQRFKRGARVRGRVPHARRGAARAARAARVGLRVAPRVGGRRVVSRAARSRSRRGSGGGRAASPGPGRVPVLARSCRDLDQGGHRERVAAARAELGGEPHPLPVRLGLQYILSSCPRQHARLSCGKAAWARGEGRVAMGAWRKARGHGRVAKGAWPWACTPHPLPCRRGGRTGGVWPCACAASRTWPCACAPCRRGGRTV